MKTRKEEKNGFPKKKKNYLKIQINSHLVKNTTYRQKKIK